MNSNKIPCEEYNNVKKYLDSHNIEWWSILNLPTNEYELSIWNICGEQFKITYNPQLYENTGFLELNLNGEISRFMTADEIIEKILEFEDERKL